ncbi:MAG: NAD(+) synthase, partial [Muribaculaceae bacterium]|nr:NAD(+) synthase [Muribaculaceae bacterium]
MTKHGFFRVAAGVPSVNVADCAGNAEAILELASRAAADGAEVIVMPEMSVTAYTCGDLFHNAMLAQGVGAAVDFLARGSEGLDIVLVAGAPVENCGRQYNCAVVIARGQVLAVVPKSYLPNYNEFYERRWWQPAGEGLSTVSIGSFRDVPFGCNQLIEINGVKVGIELCEDLWTAVPPSSRHALAGAEVMLNLSASDDVIGKYAYLRGLVAQQSARCMTAYVYAGAGYGESSTDLVFDGKAIVAENGRILREGERWRSEPQLVMADVDIDALRRDRLHTTTWGDTALREVSARYNIITVASEVKTDDGTLMRDINPLPFVPSSSDDMEERCNEITNIQAAGLARRLDVTHTRHLVVGISGGLDSTLALLIAVKAFDRLGLDRKGIVGVTMPGFGTTGRTYN